MAIVEKKKNQVFISYTGAESSLLPPVRLELEVV